MDSKQELIRKLRKKKQKERMHVKEIDRLAYVLYNKIKNSEGEVASIDFKKGQEYVDLFKNMVREVLEGKRELRIKRKQVLDENALQEDIGLFNYLNFEYLDLFDLAEGLINVFGVENTRFITSSDEVIPFIALQHYTKIKGIHIDEEKLKTIHLEDVVKSLIIREETLPLLENEKQSLEFKLKNAKKHYLEEVLGDIINDPELKTETSLEQEFDKMLFSIKAKLYLSSLINSGMYKGLEELTSIFNTALLTKDNVVYLAKQLEEVLKTQNHELGSVVKRFVKQELGINEIVSKIKLKERTLYKLINEKLKDKIQAGLVYDPAVNPDGTIRDYSFIVKHKDLYLNRKVRIWPGGDKTGKVKSWDRNGTVDSTPAGVGGVVKLIREKKQILLVLVNKNYRWWVSGREIEFLDRHIPLNGGIIEIKDIPMFTDKEVSFYKKIKQDPGLLVRDLEELLNLRNERLYKELEAVKQRISILSDYINRVGI